MTLRARIALGLLAIALLLTLPLALSLSALRSAEKASAALRDQEVAASLLLGRVRTTAQQLRAADNAVLFVYEDSSSAQWMQREARTLAALADTLQPFHLDTLVRQLRASARTIETFGPVEAAAAFDRESQVAERLSEQHTIPAIDAVERTLADGEQGLRVRAQDRVDAATKSAGRARDIAALLLGLALLGSLVVSVWLTRSISRPVSDLERGMDAVAGGELTHRLAIDPERPDEFGRLAASFQSMAGQLAEADKLKAQFISIASHELKTPLNVIIGYLTLLSENLYGPLTEKQLEVLATVEGQAHALSRLVQHLLDVSRFQAGAGRLDVKPLEIRPFLAQLEQAFHVLALQRGIAFTITAADGLPARVTWDADRIDEVLGNLLSNAFKFTDHGGRVELTVAPDAQTPELVLIEVVDSGAGIPPEQLANVFDTFFQADNQGAAAAKGSGLGLAIAKKFVEAHGGSITVTSAVGSGTRFTIRLPVHAGNSATVPAGLTPSTPMPAVLPSGEHAVVGAGVGTDVEHEPAEAAR